MDLGKVGVWWSRSWRVESEPALDVAAELETLGYSALWSSGGFATGLAPHFGHLLGATEHLVVASGIVSIWASPPQEIAESVAHLDAQYPDRFLLGLGASHAPIAADYSRPYSKMIGYLDTLDSLDSLGGAVTQGHRVLAALGPRMLELAKERSLGAHPYFVPVQHTARTRQILGRGPLLAPEVTVVLESDPAKARALARTFTELYLTLPNYTNNLRSFGFTDDDLAGAGSDQLVDAVVCWGDVDTVVAKVRAHHEAGADHVCIQMVSPPEGSFPLTQYRELATALFADSGGLNQPEKKARPRHDPSIREADSPR